MPEPTLDLSAATGCIIEALPTFLLLLTLYWLIAIAVGAYFKWCVLTP